MGKNDWLVKELADKLENTVSAVHYAHLIKCLKRCQELLAEAAARTTDIELRTDMRIYAAALDGFFDDVSHYPNAYFNITEGYDPVSYLRKRGVIKEPPPPPVPWADREPPPPKKPRKPRTKSRAKPPAKTKAKKTQRRK